MEKKFENLTIEERRTIVKEQMSSLLSKLKELPKPETDEDMEKMQEISVELDGILAILNQNKKKDE